VERACSLAATDTAPVAEIEHIVRALIEPGSEIASLLESFGVRRGDLRGSEPEVQAAAAERTRSTGVKREGPAGAPSAPSHHLVGGFEGRQDLKGQTTERATGSASCRLPLLTALD